MITLVTSQELARLTGYNVRYIRSMASAGKLPAERVGQQWMFKPDALAPKLGYVPPDEDAPDAPAVDTFTRICGRCQHYERRWCNKLGRAVHHNSVARECSSYDARTGVAVVIKAENEDAEPEIKTYRPEASEMPAPITEQQTATVLQVYRQTGKVDPAAKAAGCSYSAADRVIKESKVVEVFNMTGDLSLAANTASVSLIHAKKILRKAGIDVDLAPKPQTAEAAIIAENQREAAAIQPLVEVASVSDEPLPQSDALNRIRTDLEEAQRALAICNEIRRIYGDDAPELEQAAVQVYMRRRTAA